MIRNGPTSLTRFVAATALRRREKKVPDPRAVKLRRPFGWTQEQFESYLRAGTYRGLWTWSIRDGRGVANLVVGDALFDAVEAAQ